MARMLGLGLVAALLVALIGLAGCTIDSTGSTNEPTEKADEPTTASEAEAEAAGWFEGAWTVEHELVTVEPEMMRAAADQQSAQWEAQAEGDEMVLLSDEHEYHGTFTENGDAWTYDGTATYVDDEGTTWTSHIVVEGMRDGDDAFTAQMWGEISSDTGGVLYEATWDQVGSRTL